MTDQNPLGADQKLIDDLRHVYSQMTPSGLERMDSERAALIIERAIQALATRAHRPVEQEAVAYIGFDRLSDWRRERREYWALPLWRDAGHGRVPLYASPPSRALSQDERDGCEGPEVAMACYIEALRADEGDTVTICCDDPEAMSSKRRLAVDCNGGWTDWRDRRFYGESVLQCLALAVLAREQALQTQPEGEANG